MYPLHIYTHTYHTLFSQNGYELAVKLKCIQKQTDGNKHNLLNNTDQEY